MGRLTLIKTLTASDSSTLAFVDGASDVVFGSAYDEYMFVFTDIGPATNGGRFQFQVNATDDAGGGYDTSLITSTSINAGHAEHVAEAELNYYADGHLAQSAAQQTLVYNCGNAADESIAGILHIFSPSSTTYVKHFYARFGSYRSDNYTLDLYTAGYINDTTAIDEIQFKMASGNFDGVIQMYGIK
jgi:hypothetical protein